MTASRRLRGPAAVVAALSVAAGGCAFAPVDLEVTEPDLAQSSRILAADGTVITTLRGGEHRENVRLRELPEHLPDAVVAVEDARFWSHGGVDLRATLRAAATNAREGEVVQGGSTITQQYVKNTIVGPERTIERKIQEARLAIEMERRYTKKRILELYLNTIYLGNGAYGVQAAADEYFGVAAADVSLAQAATLAAIIRAPTAYDPYDRPQVARRRRDAVLRRMRELDLAPSAEVRAAMAEPLVLAEPTPEDRYPAAHFVEQVKRFVLDDPRFGETSAERQELLFGGGLRITTTLDLELQLRAEEAVGRVRPAAGPDAALVSLEPGTGNVRALVGGPDFFSGEERAKFDLATGGQGRPAGSAFKPLVLAAALEEGIPLDRVYPSPPHIDIPLSDRVWEVDNYEGSGGGTATLQEATVASYNTVYAQVIEDVGPADAMAMAARLGITTPLVPVHAAVLGTNDVHPIDMASAYATLANGGIRVAPTFVTRVATSGGEVLYAHQNQPGRALDAVVADQVTDVLQEVVVRGTGVRAAIGRPAAGKTGTGQDWTDAWFVGYTPDLATAVWMGYAEEGRVPMVPPATPFRVSGGTWPATIWQLFMSAALADVPVTPFPEPALPPPPEEEVEDPVAEDRSLPRVRDVVGMPADRAEAALVRDGFVVGRRLVPSDDYPPGYVVASDPPAGSRRAGGTVVHIDVANGRRETAKVPDVLGMEEDRAVAALRRADLEAEVVREREPPAPGRRDRAGKVWKQQPAGDRTTPTGSTVRIWVNPSPG